MSEPPPSSRYSPRPKTRDRPKRDKGSSLPTSAAAAAAQAGRKNRTIFSEEQHSALLAAYDADKYPTTIQKELLARQLGLQPIVVINWFQHRRQREPVKEKGGYVRNTPRSDGVGGGSESPFINVHPLPNGEGTTSAQVVPSFQEYFNKDGRPIQKPTAQTPTAMEVENGTPPTEENRNGSTRDSTPATTPIISTPVASIASAPPLPAPPLQKMLPSQGKPLPYYGRMQTVKPPHPIDNGETVPKSANAHIGHTRWELDPLYIAPYVDHGFKEALLPKDANSKTASDKFALRPSPLLRQQQQQQQQQQQIPPSFQPQPLGPAPRPQGQSQPLPPLIPATTLHHYHQHHEPLPHQPQIRVQVVQPQPGIQMSRPMLKIQPQPGTQNQVPNVT